MRRRTRFVEIFCSLALNHVVSAMSRLLLVFCVLIFFDSPSLRPFACFSLEIFFTDFFHFSKFFFDFLLSLYLRIPVTSCSSSPSPLNNSHPMLFTTLFPILSLKNSFPSLPKAIIFPSLEMKDPFRNSRTKSEKHPTNPQPLPTPLPQPSSSPSS